MIDVNDIPLDVTAVTPTFNRAALIERALDSVRHQTRRVTEIIVVDDGSSDGTPDVVRAWAARHAQPVRVVTMERNGGPAAARNRGIQLASTRYVAFLDSDDEWAPEAMQTLCGGLDKHAGAVLGFGDATVVTPTECHTAGLFAPRVQIDQMARPLDDHWFALRNAGDTLLPASIIPTSATCFRREDALQVGGMPEQFRSGEDWLFFLRMTQRGDFIFTGKDLALHHRHDSNLTGPLAAEFMAREKLNGLLALRSGSAGLTLSETQRQRVDQMQSAQRARWRYHLSRMGWSHYLKGLGTLPAPDGASIAAQLLSAPRDALRALAASAGLVR